ncbi:MAG: glycoside hydrolase family 98 domain-containing protein [Phocaeicola sp.]
MRREGVIALKKWLYASICCIILLVGCKDEIKIGEEEILEEQPSIILSKELNENITSLRKLVNASRLGLSIKNTITYEDKSGYTIYFSNGLKVDIQTKEFKISFKDENQESENRDTLFSPIVGIKKWKEEYYWTINNNFISIKDNTTDPSWMVNSQSLTPSINFTSDEFWELCHGDSIVQKEKIKGGVLKSYFAEVDTTTNGQCQFIFSDGTSLSFPTKLTDNDSEGLMGQIRRPINPQQPMWLIHIDTWLEPDPQKVINLIPEDILPYVVFNISLSVDGDRSTGEWRRVKYGYETAKSWLRTCAENRVWAMIQPSSGAYCHFPDIYNYEEMKNSVYAEFYKEYPNFIGFNYCEQFWGFQSTDNPHTVTFQERLEHWVHLMNLSHEYGGYLIVSCCGPYYGASMNPVGMFKQNTALADICARYPENLIICEKFTSKYGFHNTESASLGAYLSGYAGNYGIRFDITGWNGLTENDECPVPSGTIPVVEHVMLTGQTVIDGPELIPTQCYREVSTTSSMGGYTSRQWETFPQFNNISIDLFRKILDGTIPILEKEEVIERTKLILIHDVNSGNDREKYTAPDDLYEGLYQMDNDGRMLNNRSWFKKTGRYPTIPYAFQLAGSQANAFKIKMNISEYSAKWANIENKISDMNQLFPQEYEGDMYAARIENRWVTYNPYKTGQKTTAIIPFKYNSCQQMELSYSLYSLGVITEHSNQLKFYLSNYDNKDTSLKTDTIKIVGANSEPSYSFIDRGNHASSRIVKSWINNIFTLEVTHNGPLDLTINCTGDSLDRLICSTKENVLIPNPPQIYEGIHQYEAENFDYKNIDRIQKNAYQQSVTDYTALGYLEFGTKASASVRQEISVLKTGSYSLDIKYLAPNSNITTVDLYVNGEKVSPLLFSKTTSNWDVTMQIIKLHKGANTIELKANGTGSGTFYLDNITIANYD